MISAATSSHQESDRRTAAPRVGCVFRPQLPPEVLASVAHAADAAGLHELWLWEDCFAEGGMTTAAIALANSQTLTVGVGVLLAPLRNVALTAMEIACLERAFPGRVRIGVGHGVQDWMRQVGAHVSSPMTLLREYFTCLRALLRGDTVTFEGKYVSLTNVCLQWPPSGAVELLAAATGPKTLSLSGELATGTVLTGGTSPEGVRQALTHIEFGMAAGGVSSFIRWWSTSCARPVPTLYQTRRPKCGAGDSTNPSRYRSSAMPPRSPRRRAGGLTPEPRVS